MPDATLDEASLSRFLDAFYAKVRRDPLIGPVFAGAVPDEEALRAFLATKLAAFKIPARFHFSAEPLPRLGTGKIDRVALKQQFSA